MSEPCARCGSVGEDRRTLWMACFYAMGELAVPFGRASLLGRHCEKVGEERRPLTGMTFAVWGEPEGDERHHPFHTLRVCKRCRAEWMAAIETWFRAAPRGDDHDADVPPGTGYGSGIFVRENGSLREITRAEWEARRAARAASGAGTGGGGA